MRIFSKICLPLILSCFLGVHNGQLALWRENASQPEMVFPCPVQLLPETDRRALAEGIPVNSSQELARLLEDFVS